MFWTSDHETEKDKDDDPLSDRSGEHENGIILPHPPQGRTLLPAPAAAIVSGITGITSFYVRAGTKVGGWGLYATREATLKTLSVSRSVLESVLVAAGRDVSYRSNGEVGRAEAENLLERSVRSSRRLVLQISPWLKLPRYLPCTQPYRRLLSLPPQVSF